MYIRALRATLNKTDHSFNSVSLPISWPISSIVIPAWLTGSCSRIKYNGMKFYYLQWDAEASDRCASRHRTSQFLERREPLETAILRSPLGLRMILTTSRMSSANLIDSARAIFCTSRANWLRWKGPWIGWMKKHKKARTWNWGCRRRGGKRLWRMPRTRIGLREGAWSSPSSSRKRLRNTVSQLQYSNIISIRFSKLQAS